MLGPILPFRHTDPLSNPPTLEPVCWPWAKWCYGIALPIFLLGYGIKCFITQHGWLPGRGGGLQLTGHSAIALGITVMAAALWLLAHHVLSETERFWRWSNGVIVIAISVFIASLGYIIVIRMIL